MVVFEERGNRSTRRKPLGAEKRTNKLNRHTTPDLGIEPRPHWWEASALTTAPSLHPKENANKFSYDKNDITNPTNKITFLISLSFSFLAGVYQINHLIVIRSSSCLIFKRKEPTLEFRNFLQKPSKGQTENNQYQVKERSFEEIWKCFCSYLKVFLFVAIQKILLMSKEMTPWRSGKRKQASYK